VKGVCVITTLFGSCLLLYRILWH